MSTKLNSEAIFEITIPQFSKTLKNLKRILNKTTEFSAGKKVEADLFLNFRLAPDQFPLVRQIQIACDTAKLCASRLTGVTAPTHEDNEKTFTEIMMRIDSTVDFLDSMKLEKYGAASAQKITHQRWGDKYMTGEDFVLHHAVPNFYFHVTTAYAIIRHSGVDIGKSDYLGEMPFRIN